MAAQTQDARNRKTTRARAARILKLPESAIENDLLDFVLARGDALLRARAGSGKTTALAVKIGYLVHDLGVPPSRIMVVTFNNAAARHIERKLSGIGIPEQIRVRTFHALGQRIVRAHFGASRTCVFDEKSKEGEHVARLMRDSLETVVNEKFYGWCASRMRTHYRKRREYVESIGYEALLSATNFLRARGYGLQNRWKNAWEDGPIVGNAMKTVLEYESRLKSARLLDGPSVLQAASWTLEREIERASMRPSDAHDVDWIFIDEFQDVSQPYMRLVEAIRELNGGTNVQGVGDENQAINGFAGSEVSYLLEAEKHLENPKLLNLLKNRRSGAKIVDWGNSVMADADEDTIPAIADPDNGPGNLEFGHVSSERDIRFIAGRLADMANSDARSTALIARRWKVGDHPLSGLKNILQKELDRRGIKTRITALSGHASKGLEYDAVMLLDDGTFPLQHPSRPILEPLIPQSDFLREETCLKHVAGTRARQSLNVIRM